MPGAAGVTFGANQTVDSNHPPAGAFNANLSIESAQRGVGIDDSGVKTKKRPVSAFPTPVTGPNPNHAGGQKKNSNTGHYNAGVFVPGGNSGYGGHQQKRAKVTSAKWASKNDRDGSNGAGGDASGAGASSSNLRQGSRKVTSAHPTSQGAARASYSSSDHNAATAALYGAPAGGGERKVPVRGKKLHHHQYAI